MNKLINLIPFPYRVLIALSFAGFIFGSGIYTGIRWEKYITQKNEIKVQTERADNAEKQRDIANRAPASVDDMLNWLSDDK